MQTIVSMLADRARSQPASTVLIWQDTAIDAATFDALSTAGAMFLADASIAPGDRVLLRLHNSRELAIAYYACFKAGAIAVPVRSGASNDEIAHIIKTCQPRVGLTQASLPPLDPSLPWFTLDQHWPEPGKRHKLPTADLDNVAVILHTSGTTGQERGVTHTHRSLHGLLNAYQGSQQTRNRTLVPLPLVHSYGLFTFVSLMSIGGTVILLDKPDAENMLNAIDRHAATMAIATPAVAYALAQVQTQRPRRLPSLSHVNVSGDMVSLDLQQRFNELFGNRMRRTYGATEIGPIAGEFAGSVGENTLGFPFPGVDISILDAHGRDLPDGGVGEIVVRSPAMASGYWQDDAATAATFRSGCWHTGDLGFRDQAKRLYFSGRKKELIVRAGQNISPLQIEEVLRRHPAVNDVAVWGIPDAALGQLVAAWVVASAPVSAGQLCEFVRPHVAENKCPERIFFVTALPRTAVGKVQRRILTPPGEA